MADPLRAEDVAGLGGAGCSHDKLDAVVAAGRDWFTSIPLDATKTTFQNFKLYAEDRLGRSLTNALAMKLLRTIAEEQT